MYGYFFCFEFINSGENITKNIEKKDTKIMNKGRDEEMKHKNWQHFL